jgi:hypothetical protein
VGREDGFFYDVLKFPDGEHFPVKIRSMVGLIPLFAVETLEPGLLDRLPGFKRRMEWFIDNRPDLTANVAPACGRHGMAERRLLSIVDAGQLRRMLQIMLDESRNFSRPTASARSRAITAIIPSAISFDGKEHRVDYEPGESTTGTVRRQFELARARVVSRELSADRVAAEVSSLFRRRFQSRIPFAAPATGSRFPKLPQKSRTA